MRLQLWVADEEISPNFRAKPIRSAAKKLEVGSIALREARFALAHFYSYLTDCLANSTYVAPSPPSFGNAVA